jgi:hypothetical protein
MQHQQPAINKRHSNIIFLVALGAIILCLLWLYFPQVASAMRALEPTCTVGITGTAATFTIQAWTANEDCHKITGGEASFLGSPIQRGGVYLGEQDRNEPIICELDDQGRHIIVRDQGIFKIVGNGVCQGLYKQQGEQQ